eukprot:m.310059 g.310059  ORF g.310059 m.310059 type:complete len:468 (+) comp16474_c0_seq12:355-1758(+)
MLFHIRHLANTLDSYAGECDAGNDVSFALWAATITCVIIHVFVYGGASSGKLDLPIFSNANFRNIACRYLPAFFLATFSDWMTGPYIYRLYEHYGFTTNEIGILFVVGFASSLVFGTCIGSVADRTGRKASCLLFCFVISLACVLKNFSGFSPLALGRVFGGIYTSLLYSSFESWVGSEFVKLGMEKDLPQLYSLATFGNALVAVIAGFTANGLAEVYGYTAPFNAAIGSAILCFPAIYFLWGENYGTQKSESYFAISDSLKHIRNDRGVFLIGSISALFEAALYVFVFLWTPSLELRCKGQEIPLGHVFALYMVCKMCGTGFVSLLEKMMSIEFMLQCVLFFAGTSLLLPVFVKSGRIALFGHAMFEFCVGMYWPVVMSLRGKFVDESVRSTTFNLFRVPLNIMVVFCLLFIEKLAEHQIYIVCGATLFIALVLATSLRRRRRLRTVDLSTKQRMLERPASPVNQY